jgi:DNA repair exonuclease SbcCD ATPase subunit
MLRYILISAFLILNLNFSFAQFQTVESEHYLLGVDVKGFEIILPFSKEKTEESWKQYAKDFGKSEETQAHKTYQTTFRTDIYSEEILIFSQIKGNKDQSTIWAGIDPQGIPKDVYPKLQEAIEEFIYNFNIKMRTDLAQKKIDESEQAATYLSKEFESLKKDERKNQKSLEKTNERITSYAEKLRELRSDSTQYSQKLESLKSSIDSLYIELEKVKSVVETYKKKMEDIK